MDSGDTTSTAGTNTTDISVYEGEVLMYVKAGSTESVTIDVSFHPGGIGEKGIVLIANETIAAGGLVHVLMPLEMSRLVHGDIHVTWYGCTAGETLNATIGVMEK